jgi:hypothetical protein
MPSATSLTERSVDFDMILTLSAMHFGDWSRSVHQTLVDFGLRPVKPIALLAASSRRSDMPYEFDFDISSEVFEDYRTRQLLPGELTIRVIAKHHKVDITRIDYHGPGGGNPNIFATAPNRQRAREFLTEVYECKTEEDIKSYCDPALPGPGRVTNT